MSFLVLSRYGAAMTRAVTAVTLGIWGKSRVKAVVLKANVLRIAVEYFDRTLWSVCLSPCAPL
jgi:hypothetical protein